TVVPAGDQDLPQALARPDLQLDAKGLAHVVPLAPHRRRVVGPPGLEGTRIDRSAGDLVLVDAASHETDRLARQLIQLPRPVAADALHHRLRAAGETRR